MKILAATALVMSLSFLATSPGKEVKWGKPEKKVGYNTSYMPLGWSDGSFFMARIDGFKGYLMKVDNNLNISSQGPLIIDDPFFEADLMYLRDNEIFVLSSEYDMKLTKNFVKASTFSLSAEPGKMKSQKVATVDLSKYGERAEFKYFFSPDSSKLLILHLHHMKAKSKAKVTIIVLESGNLAEIWNSTAILPYNGDDVTFLSAGISNDSKVVMLTTIKGDEGESLERYFTSIFSFNQHNKEFEEKILDVKNKFLSTVKLKFTNNNQVVLTGFYYTIKDGKNQGITGAFTANVELSELSKLEVKTFEMDSEMLESITPQGAFSKMLHVDFVSSYYIQQFEFNANGSGYAIAEQQYYTSQKDRNTQTATRTYYFNHLIIYHFDENQEVKWFCIVPKNQVSSVSSFSTRNSQLTNFPASRARLAYKYTSFLSMEKNGNIYILYNDHKKNGDARTVKDTKLMNNVNAALATLVTVNKNGDWNKEALFSSKDAGAILEPSSSYMISNQGFLISAEKGKNLQFGFLAL